MRHHPVAQNGAPMPQPPGNCGFHPSCKQATTRHTHPYTVKAAGARRCTCGSRRWKVTTGGPLPVQVSCENCTRQNVTATAYERGRAEGPREVTDASAAPPF
jgi:hypothetical protein